MPLILPRLQNDLFPCLNLRPDNIYTQQGKTLLTTPTMPLTASNSLLSPQTSNWSSSFSLYQYELIFLPANVSKCYGCSQSFAEKIQASSIQHSYEAQRSTYLRCGHYVLKNNYFAEQLLIAITLLGLSSLCTYIALLGQKLLWVESLTIFVNFELIRESLWRWKFSLGWFTKVYLYEFLYEVKNFLNEAKKS